MQTPFQGDPRLAGMVATLRHDILARMRADALDLPLLPQVAMKVLSLAASGDADPKALANLLRNDQSMTVHVLRVVNAPFYRARTTIDSLDHAVMRLGCVKVRQIALAIACKQRVFKVRGFEPEVYRAFRHSLATALFAQEIARTLGTDQGEAFLAGLLHDVGRPVLLQAVVDVQPNARLLDGPAILAVVAELHTQVGGLLARKWNLPPRICEAIAGHHDRDTSLPLVMLVSLADDLAIAALEPERGTQVDAGSHWTQHHLKLTREALTAIILQRGELMDTLVAVV
jgi:putative nucleotidyltransferase with HDIG domain